MATGKPAKKTLKRTSHTGPASGNGPDEELELNPQTEDDNTDVDEDQEDDDNTSQSDADGSDDTTPQVTQVEPASDPSVDPERPWMQHAPKDGRTLGPNEPLVVEGFLIGKRVVFIKDHYRAVLPWKSKRWTYSLLFREGHSVSVDRVQTVLDTRQPQESPSESGDAEDDK